METLSGSLGLLQVVGQFGLAGLILVLWVFSDRARSRDAAAYRTDSGKMLDAYREDMKKVLEHYRQDAEEARRFYGTNVKLVEGYESLAKDLKDLIIMNTQAWTRTCVVLENNLAKFAKGPQG
jgi:hypothetical protein